MSNVRSLFGNTTVDHEPNATCIAECKRLLEAAQAGEVVGVAVVRLHKDNMASYSLAGIAGGFSMLGAAEMVKSELVMINDGWDQ